MKVLIGYCTIAGDRRAIVPLGRRLQVGEEPIAAERLVGAAGGERPSERERGEEHLRASGLRRGRKLTVIVIGTSTATQFSSVGVNSHCRIAVAAASSRSGFEPDVVWRSLTVPSVPMRAANTKTPPMPASASSCG